MSRILKVYGTNTSLIGKQARTIAATTSQKRFAELIGTSLGYVRDYASITENVEECKIAFGNVNTVFVHCPTCEHWHELRKP